MHFWHQFDLPKCQVHRGNAAKYLNGHFGGLFVYFLHFAPKTRERALDDLRWTPSVRQPEPRLKV